MSEHRIVHVEIPAVSGKESSRFYDSAFGWKGGESENSATICSMSATARQRL